MSYTQRPVSASAVSRLLKTEGFHRANSGKHWNRGFQVTGMGTLVEVNYMASRDESSYEVMERMVEALNAKAEYVAWIGRPDWMNAIADNSFSVMIRKTSPAEAADARAEETAAAKAIEDAKVTKKAAEQEATLQDLRDALAARPVEGTVVTSERPQEAVQAIQELEIEWDLEHQSLAAVALPALRVALDAHPKADFFTKLIGEDDDMVLHVRHFHGTKVRVAAVHFEEMGGTFFTHHTEENFTSVAAVVAHLELFLVGE